MYKKERKNIINKNKRNGERKEMKKGSIKILLIGSNGQLGYEFVKLFKKLVINYTTTDYNSLDMTNKEMIINFFKKNNNFTHIINCAAYNDVDKAENDTEQCIKINEEAPLIITRYAKNMGAVFITYSSDFVFDGRKKNPYLEKDIISPLSVYGKSKSNMEEKILNEYEKVFVIRTSWLFGISGKNFNTQVINWSKTRNELNI
ncbi:sugar nucleotide-binding protein, partial [Leptotrichia trevisanii]|uniref:SDR family oxidoreductase n=1 Tax=Leptotrichia trevisanii TaxID=109328 RepID=UPI0026EB532D